MGRHGPVQRENDFAHNAAGLARHIAQMHLTCNERANSSIRNHNPYGVGLVLCFQSPPCVQGYYACCIDT